jgi:hypothetical protein
MGEERRLDGAEAALEHLEREVDALVAALSAAAGTPAGGARRPKTTKPVARRPAPKKGSGRGRRERAAARTKTRR